MATETLIKTDEITTQDTFNRLILWNDEINTFDHVINTLILILKHTPIRAEQCALIAHTKGKCSVESGPLQKLRPLRTDLTACGLNATIE